MSKETLSYETINPLLCGLYEEIWKLEAILYVRDKVDIDDNKAPYVREWLLNLGVEIATESVSQLHDLMEKLCDRLEMSPNFQALGEGGVDNG